MPYMLSQHGREELSKSAKGLSSLSSTWTELQKKAMNYLSMHQDENRYIGAAEVAQFYGYPNGQYFRGVLASLHHYGLLTKKEM